jgi:DNA-binding PadR family transcriptional regulator
VQREVRFAEPSALILASLSSGPKHGYALIKDIEQIADATLGPGTLYGALTGVVQRGLVEALPAEDRRRPHRITPADAEAAVPTCSTRNGWWQSGLRRLEAYG